MAFTQSSAVGVVTLDLILARPTESALFRFGPLHRNDILLTLGVGVAVLIAAVKALGSLQTAATQNANLEA